MKEELEHIDYKKALIIALFMLCVFLLLKVINISSKNDHLVDSNKVIDQIKREKDSLIAIHFNQIDQLSYHNQKLAESVNAQSQTINKLQKEKQRIKIIYLDKITKIDSFTSNQLQNYWKNELE